MAYSKKDSKSTSSSSKTKSAKKKTSTKTAVSKKKELDSIKKEETVSKPVLVKEEKKLDSIPTLDTKGIILLVASAVFFLILSVFFFLRMREDAYSKNWENQSYLVKKELAPEVSCEGLSNAILGTQAFLFVTSYNEEEFALEKDLAKMIKKYELSQDFYVYPYQDECSDYMTRLGLDSTLEKIPTILYYRNGKLAEIVQREDEKMIEAGDFQRLLDIYEIAIERK